VLTAEETGHIIPAAVSPPHDQRAHGLPRDLRGSDEESADPPVATGTEPAKQARQKPLDEESADPPVATGTEPAKQARQKPLDADLPMVGRRAWFKTRVTGVKAIPSGPLWSL
jgi:hypothetical protein